MDPQLAEIRRMQAERYKKASPEDKPQHKVCPDCNGDPYVNVCPVTGRLHNKDSKVIGGTVLDKGCRQMTSQQLFSAIDQVRVKWQPARTQMLTVDTDSVNMFQSFVASRYWKLHRYGIMYGTVEKDSGVVKVHSIYEPEQEGSETGFTPMADKRLANVDALAFLLGFRRVGLVCTHPPRDKEEIVLSGQELSLLQREQSCHGDHCCLLTISPNAETGQVEAEAWQSTQQGVHLFQIGFLEAHPDTPGALLSKSPLEIAQDEADKSGHKRCIIKEPSTTVDTRWMTSPVAVDAFESNVCSNRFVRISRPGELPPSMENLKNYFNDPKRKRLNFVERVSDFHVLIFVMEHILHVKSDMPRLVECVLARDNDGAKAFEEIVKACMAM